MTALRPIRHEDRLSLVDHLDELRKRLIVCIVVFLVAFGVCLWQDNAILDIINRPLDHPTLLHRNTAPKNDPLERTAAFQEQLRKTFLASARTYDSFAAAAFCRALAALAFGAVFVAVPPALCRRSRPNRVGRVAGRLPRTLSSSLLSLIASQSTFDS